MNKEKLDSWIAKAGEHKIAIGVAAVCTVAILGSLLWPNPKPQPPISEVKTTAAPAAPAFSPATPAPQPGPAAAAPAPQPAPAAPASVPAPAAPSTMQKELEAKPLFPSSPPPPAPKPATPAPQAKPMPKPPAPKPVPVAKPAAPTPARARTAPLKPVPVATIPAGYYVQLGSFKQKAGATELAKKAASRHWSVYVAPRPGGLHAVWIGPYRTRTEADRAKQQLHKDVGISGFIVQSR